MSANDEKRYIENYEKLISQGVDEAWLTKNYGAKIENKSVGPISTAWNTTGKASVAAEKASAQAALDARTPDFLKNNPSFQNLTPDMKEIAIYNYEVQKSNDAQKAQALNTALEQATAQADPYWKNIIRIAQDEVMRTFEAAQGDYTSANERLTRRIEEINQDLASNKQYLSLTQQAELSNLANDLVDRQQTFELNKQYIGAEKASQLQGLELQYNKDVDDINRNLEFSTEEKNAALKTLDQQFKIQRSSLIGNAAQAGLTFATKRKIAEQQLADQNSGLVESTMRTYNKQQADLTSNLSYAGSQYGIAKEGVNRQFGYQMSQEEMAMETANRKVQEEREKLQRDYSKQIADLETDAARGNTEAASQIVDLKRKLQESITSAGRTAEAYLGTENMPSTPGYTALGAVPGQLYEDKVKDIEARKQALYGDLTQTSLNYIS